MTTDCKLFPLACQGAGIPKPDAEYRFHPERKFRFDFAWPAHRVALEVEGGAYTNGRHTRGAGFVADCEKYTAAAVLGWRILRVVPSELIKVKTLTDLKAALEWRTGA